VGMGLLLLLPWRGQAQPWERIADGPITIRARARLNSPIREVWAEADLDASVEDLEEAILDTEGYTRFMPYVKESRILDKELPDPDGSRLVYARLELPWVKGRDYVIRVLVEKRARNDGSFQNRWFAVPGKVPPKPYLVRLSVNEGSWEVRPKGEGHSHVVYRCTVDPGGWMPGFIADMGNRTGVMDTLHAIEREAQRRAAQRKTQ